ncbi:hypothetical protein NX059_008437 [Plenodomus lindquistii]|nr:hypothetical protein NX059_008437 [Plenodomus lindquistii]
MTTSGSAYTNLESLLLFQCLHAYGVDNAVWPKISDLLKNTPDVTEHRYFQAGRLSPDALRNFYLERLRRELDYEQGGDGDGQGQSQNGDVTSSSKRKRQSPALPSVSESMKHQRLIPKLVVKLYASYRNELTEQIRADEDRYDKLQRDIQSIERGEWDDQLQERANGRSSVSQSPLPTKSPHLPQQQSSQPASPLLVQNGTRAASTNAPTPDPHQQQAHANRNGQPSPSTRQKLPPTDQRQASATPRPPVGAPSPQHDPAQEPPPSGFQPPLQPSPYNSQSYPPGPPLHASHPQAHPSPHQAVPHPAYSHPAGSPAAQFQPPFPPPYGANGVPQYGPPPPAMAPHPGYHQPYLQQQPHGPQSPGMQPGYQQQRTQYPHPGQPQHTPHHPQISLPPPQAGFMLPPFQVSPQDPSRVHHPSHAQQPPPPVSTPVSNRQQPPAPKANAQTPGPGRQGPPPIHPLVTQARQSFSTPTNLRSPHSATGTPLSAKSFWKRQSFHNTPATPASPRPEVEPLDDVPPLIRSTQQSPAKTMSPRKSRAKGQEKEKESEQDIEQVSTPHASSTRDPKQRNNQEDESLLDPEPRTGRSRRKGPIKRGRPGSLASSRAGGSVRDRSRSRSILSHTETVAGDNDSQTGHQIKSERGTSVDAIDEESADTPSHASRGRRRAPAPTIAPTSTRRKRNAREASLEEPDDQFSTPGPPKTINAQRHFSRMCAPIMNDINSHKHASTFTTAVRAKDAEGYYDIIKRPTDLKSIQKAIATGSKQVAAAATDTPAGSPGGAGGGVVELPNTSDYFPPKSIVNAAQLEKELMRMFVNAVMFNPGEDGVVEDAREMFKTVEQSVSNWRNVERSSGRAEIEDTPQAEDEDGERGGKRRKV